LPSYRGQRRSRRIRWKVADVHWLSIEEVLDHPKLLSSNRDFFEALASRAFTLHASDEALL
jgi:hypothetical protein